MPWPRLRLNDGSSMPSIAYGHIYWTGNEKIANDVGMAIESGFDHLDTAQGYYDEDKFAQAIKESGLARSDYYITTKWSRADTDIKESCENSLTQLNIKQMDLYLIHDRSLCKSDIAGRWKDMELVKKLGYTKSIGVSNFEIHDLKTLVAGADIIPAVLQNQFDPHSYAESLPLFEYCKQHGIILEAFTALWPLRSEPHGEIAQVTSAIAKRLHVEPEQVLLAWCRAKGAAVVTSSGKRSRMEGYIAAGDIELDDKDIERIDQAGRDTTLRNRRKVQLKRAGWMLCFLIASLILLHFAHTVGAPLLRRRG